MLMVIMMIIIPEMFNNYKTSYGTVLTAIRYHAKIKGNID